MSVHIAAGSSFRGDSFAIGLSFVNATPKTPGWFLLTRHWATLAGAALYRDGGVLLTFCRASGGSRPRRQPDVGIVLFLVLPFVFVVGLALSAAGIYVSRREVRKGFEESRFDRKSAMRRLGLFLAVTLLANVLIGTQLTYRAVKHMETPQFCGASCHSMAPEFAAYQNSPHSRVECVECHVAPGAAGWFASKTSGVRQLVQTVFHNEPKPVPSALASNRLVPARETCENCHWPEKFGGVSLRLFSENPTALAPLYDACTPVFVPRIVICTVENVCFGNFTI